MAEETNLMGKHVQYDAGYAMLQGVVVEYIEPITMNGAVLVSARYRVKWDDTEDVSSGLYQRELKELPHGGA